MRLKLNQYNHHCKYDIEFQPRTPSAFETMLYSILHIYSNTHVTCTHVVSNIYRVLLEVDMKGYATDRAGINFMLSQEEN
jgi:hypothetical protein